MPDLNPSRLLQRIAHGAVALLLCVAAGNALAADEGSHRHAGGTYDPSTSSYAVVAGDDLSDIAERFGVTVAELKRWNNLSSDTIDSGQTLIVAAAPAQPVTGSADAGASGYEVISGKLGSPDARASIGGEQLPAPDPEFGGVIKDDSLSSTPWWAPRIAPPEQAPNILLIITDDAGFGVPSTFGGVIPTPTMDRIASEGLRYNRVFSTALCSPTRAALITGRNHHSAGFGVISEQSSGYPGYNSIISEDKATIGRILLENGYATAWFGKDHNTPAFAASQVGPFDQWPIGMGFEYFYGFVGGDANQWQPNLFRNTTQIYPFDGQEGTWNLITGMADDAIDYIYRIHQTDPSKPLFIKYAPGATRTAPPDQGVGREDPGDEPVR